MQVIKSLADSFQCDSPSGMTPFDPTQYMGIWYEQMHAKNQPFQPDSWTCSTAQYYNLDTSAYTFTVSNTGEGAHQTGNYRFGVTGDGSCPTPDTAECYVAFFGASTDYPNYVVLETDYTSYSVIYTCEAEDEFAYLWFMAREPVASDDLIQYMYSVAENNLIYFDYDNLLADTQGDMCTYPDPQPDILPTNE